MFALLALLTPLHCGRVEGSGGATSSGTTSEDSAAPTAEVASFELLVNGAPQDPLGCPSNPWVYPEASAGSKVALVNTGTAALPYMARQWWSIDEGDVPGVLGRNGSSLAGVLMPGEQVDITPVFTATAEANGGIVALVGSAISFSDAAGSLAPSGTVAWPAGVTIGDGTPSTMNVVQVESASNCQQSFSEFW